MRKHILLSMLDDIATDDGWPELLRAGHLRRAVASAHTFSFGRHDLLDSSFFHFGDDLRSRGLLRLPFETVLFEVECPPTDSLACAVSVFGTEVETEEEGLLTLLYPFFHERGGAVVACCVVVLKSRTGQWRVGGVRDPGVALSEQEQEVGKWAAGLFQGLVATLASRDASLREVAAPARLNVKRAKAGRLPLHDYIVVEIPRSKRKGPPLGGTHASPRLHWRRGHYRHLPGDRLVPVSPSLVGSSEFGTRVKDYAVTVHAAPNLPAEETAP